MRNLFHPENSGSLQNTKFEEPSADILRQSEPSVAGASETEIRKSKIEKLLSLLSPADRKGVADTLDHGSSATVHYLARILSRERDQRRSRATGMRVCAAMLALYVVFFGPLLLLSLYPVVTLLSMLVVIPLALFLAVFDPPGRLEEPVFEALIDLAEVQDTGIVLEQMHVGSLENRKRARTSLVHLLPQLLPENRSLLTAPQRAQLHSILSSGDRDRYIKLRLAAVAALEQIGDRDSLRALHVLANAEAATRAEQAVRTAVQKCLYDLVARLDFGRPEDIPRYLAESYNRADSQTMYPLVSADSLYAMITLLPQLTPTNYRQILTPADRDRLYGLFSRAVIDGYGYDKFKLHREIVRAAAQIEDTRAMNVLRQLASMEAPTDGARQLRAEAKEALRVLKLALEKEKVSQTLLRGSSAPDALPGELLRAAAPAESETTANELLRASAQQKSVTVTVDLMPEESKTVLLQRPEDPGR